MRVYTRMDREHITQAVNQKVYFYDLNCGCRLRTSFELIGIWTRPAYCGLAISSPGQEFNFEKSKSVDSFTNRMNFNFTSPLQINGVPQGCFSAKKAFLDLSGI
jgi:hypothetical protein